MVDREPQPARAEDALERAREALTAAGLALPYVPQRLLSKFQDFSPWRWGTQEQPRPYLVREHVANFYRAHARDPIAAGDESVVFGHDGHGINSFAFYCYAVTTHLALFLHLGWGGVLMPEPETSERIGRCVQEASRLTEGAEALSTEDFPRPFVVVATDFYGGFCERSDAGLKRPWPHQKPDAVLAAARARLSL